MSAPEHLPHRGLRPRVALVRSRYDPLGGTERFVRSAMQALLARGASVTLVTRQWPDTDGSALVLDPYHAGGLWRDWGFARAVRKALARQHFDLVQSHERIAGCDLYRADEGVHREWLRQRARAQVPLVALATALSPYHRHALASERALYASPRLRAVICNSEMVRGDIANHYGVAHDKLVLIRNAVDRGVFHPGLRREFREGVRQQLKIPASANVVLHVGSNYERKGVAALLGALQRATPEAWAIIVGKDAGTARYVGLARRLGIGERVRFVGAVSDVRPYYGAADSFALPALYDPFPHAALEAMACALPVVTSTRCGASELVREGESGFVRDALDTVGLADALSRLDPAAAARLGANAADAVAPLTPAFLAQEYLALYDRLMGK